MGMDASQGTVVSTTAHTLTSTTHAPRTPLTYTPFFCKEGQNPYDLVEWKLFQPVLKDSAGSVLFAQKDVEAPADWSDRAVRIVAQKYFRGQQGTPERETSVRQMVTRVVDTINLWLNEQHYFASPLDACAFCNDLTYLLLTQHGTFNSPVWFNLGVADTPQQVSACFVQSVRDTMESIAELQRNETMIFKRGSGSGTNYSTIRSHKEKLKGGGRPSGPLSFMEGLDAWGGVIKSGGKTRRAAKMAILNADHPDILEFVNCKLEEEKKAQALIAAGYSAQFNDPNGAYASVKFQNANHTVRVPDEFMLRVQYALKHPEEEVTWDLHAVTTGEVLESVPVLKLWNAICDAAWQCGDPGIQFHDTHNAWHTCPEDGPLTGTNPCQPDFAPVLTPQGIRTFKDINVGDTIWSGTAWTKIVAKSHTGVKDVYRYHTRAGIFVGTSTHRILCHGDKVEVGQAEAIDIAVGPRAAHNEPLDPQDVLAGLTFGSSYCDNKEIPRCFVEGNRTKVRGFLRGLYSVDSVIRDSRIILVVPYAAVAEAVQQMLSSLGIRSHYHVTTGMDDVTLYRIHITSDRDWFRDIIGFSCPKKAQQLDEICNTEHTPRPAHTTYNITNIEHLGELPVWSITVEAEDHTYWTGGLHVANCSEFTFLDDTSCNLASLNLLKFDTADGFDFTAFRKAVEVFIIAQETMVTPAYYPTEKIGEMTRCYRPLGLGFANLGAYLMATGQAYDSDEGRNRAATIMSEMTATAYHTSAKLAVAKGPFDAYARNRNHVEAVLQRHLAEARQHNLPIASWELAIQQVRKSGLRNAQVTVLAPTGTTSMMMDCETTGCEPESSLYKTKHLVGGGVEVLDNRIVNRALDRLSYGTITRGRLLKYLREHKTLEGSELRAEHLAVFDCAIPSAGERILSLDAHLQMTAALQPFLSGSISKTINAANSATVQDISKTYIDAWRLGIKSITIYRDGCKQSQPLQTKQHTERAVPTYTPIRKKLADHQINTHRIKFCFGNVKGYMHVTPYEDTGLPGELFVTLAKEGSTISGLVDGWAQAISYCLQFGVPLSTLVEKFSNTKFEPAGFSSDSDIRHASSIYDALMRKLAAVFLNKPVPRTTSAATPAPAPAPTFHRAATLDAPLCDYCGTLMERSGASCHHCPSCGTSSGCG